MLARLKDPTEKTKIREQVLNGIPDQPTWYNHWTKAEVLAQKGNYTEARKFAQAAWDMGEKEPAGFFFKDAVGKALADWKNKK